MRMAALAAAFLGGASAAQNTAEALSVFTEHPRLFLRPQRLRLVQRERQRGSPRWRQFEALVRGGAQLPERGFALALFYRASGDAAAGREAVAWALTPAAGLRQTALIFDWCQDLLTPAQSRQLAARLRAGLARAPAAQDAASASSRGLAAIALWDHVPDIPGRALEETVRGWWETRTVPALRAGRNAVRREDVYALFELLHAVRDNTNADLRDAFPRFFKELPAWHLLSHYPATYSAPENDCRIGASARAGAPDLRAAALSRAAELAMVAYDSNAVESQMLQGWLMHDRFTLRDTFGAPYEFLWANPYQPGLSYIQMPLVCHDTLFGRLFARSGWEESATWFGWFDGVAQVFDEGRVSLLDPRVARPVQLGSATILFGPAERQAVELEPGERAFAVGLKPETAYRIEVEGEAAREAMAGRGGILPLEIPAGKKIEVSVRPVSAATAPSR